MIAARRGLIKERPRGHELGGPEFLLIGTSGFDDAELGNDVLVTVLEGFVSTTGFVDAETAGVPGFCDIEPGDEVMVTLLEGVSGIPGFVDATPLCIHGFDCVLEVYDWLWFRHLNRFERSLT